MGHKNTTKTTKKKPSEPSKPLRVGFYRRKLFLWPTSVAFGLIIAFLIFEFNPLPSALLIRHVFTGNDKQVLAALRKHTPSTPVTLLSNQNYKRGEKDALLDVYIPTSAVQSKQNLPVVIWTHGGAWVSGDKADDSPYFKLLASQGFTVVSVNYTLAPIKKYPAQIFELNAAHAYLLANAGRLHINPNMIFLAGDSAGSQLSSQMAALVTNPAYAKAVGITPALKPTQLAGVVLFCGIYKMAGLTEAVPNLPKLVSWGDDQVVWAYSGTRDDASPVIQQMSPYYHVTKDFPATFISGGNGDPLTTKQSMPLADKLKGLGVRVTTLFYTADHQPSLPHEYQFNLDNTDGLSAFTLLVQFLEHQAQL